MARRTFFSFHYDRDVQRAQVVRNSWVTKPNREAAGFFDASAFERAKRSDNTLKAFLNSELQGSSVACVLIGNQTAHRRWVRYELVKSFATGKGLFGIYVEKIKNFKGQIDTAGPNPLAMLACRIENDRAYFYEKAAGVWKKFADLPSISASDVGVYGLRTGVDYFFHNLFPTYGWFAGNGANNLGAWVEAAAKKAKR